MRTLLGGTSVSLNALTAKPKTPSDKKPAMNPTVRIPLRGCGKITRVIGTDLSKKDISVLGGDDKEWV
jgi:hypothetical protein